MSEPLFTVLDSITGDVLDDTPETWTSAVSVRDALEKKHLRPCHVKASRMGAAQVAEQRRATRIAQA